MRRYDQLLPQLRGLLESGDDAAVYELLLTLRPADVAILLSRLPDQRARGRVFGLLAPEAAARVLEESRVWLQRDLLRGLPEERRREVLWHMSGDELADLVGSLLPEEGTRLLDLIPDDVPAIRRLLEHREDTAGGLMTHEFVRLRETQTAAQAIDHIRKRAPDAETVYYVYVTDEQRRLTGVISLRKLIVADPDEYVGDLMDRNVISVPADMDQEDTARIVARYDLLALPVVDEDNVLLGVVTVDDALDVLREEATEDIQRLGGSQPLEQPYLQSRFRDLVNARVWWLLLLFVLQSFTITIMNHYGAALESVVLLAFFIPLLIGTAGNAGSQAATLVIRAMAVGELRFSDFFRVVWREAAVGFTLGAVMALATMLRAAWMGSPPAVGYTVALTIMLIVLTASVIGRVFADHHQPAAPGPGRCVVAAHFHAGRHGGTGHLLYGGQPHPRD